MFPNFWQAECSGGVRRRAWKQSGLLQTLNATVSKVDNLVRLPIARKNENWSQGPTVDEFCAGTYPPIIQRGPPNDLRLAWEARTGSWLMWTCGDIFAAVRLWRGCLLKTGRLSCSHPIVVCAGRNWKVVVAGWSVTCRAPGEALPSECWFSAV